VINKLTSSSLMTKIITKSQQGANYRTYNHKMFSDNGGEVHPIY
jgi:hypothetical protein